MKKLTNVDIITQSDLIKQYMNMKHKTFIISMPNISVSDLIEINDINDIEYKEIFSYVYHHEHNEPLYKAYSKDYNISNIKTYNKCKQIKSNADLIVYNIQKDQLISCLSTISNDMIEDYNVIVMGNGLYTYSRGNNLKSASRKLLNKADNNDTDDYNVKYITPTILLGLLIVIPLMMLFAWAVYQSAIIPIPARITRNKLIVGKEA